MAEEVGTAYVSIVPSLKGFSTRLRGELAGELRAIDGPVGAAGHRAGGRFGDNMREGIRSRLSGIGQMLKSGLMIGAVAVTAGLGAITAFGLKSAAALEQTQIGLEGLLGSADDAKKLIGELQTFAAETPFAFTDVADIGRRLLAAGIATREDLTGKLTTLGDLAATLAVGPEELRSVVRALAQIQAKGRLLGGELLQLEDALPGFSSRKAIAENLGIPIENVDGGAVSATDALRALFQGMEQVRGAAGAMERQSQTLLGVFSTFKDTIAIALTEAFQPIIPEIKAQLTAITPVLGEAIGALAPVLGTLLAAVLPLVSGVIQALVPIVTPIIDALGSAIAILGPELQPLGDALGEIVKAFTPLLPVLAIVIAELAEELTPVLLELAPVFAELVPPLSEILLALVPLIPSLADLLLAVLPLIVMTAKLDAWLIRLYNSFLIGPVIRALITVVTDLAEAVGGLVGWLTNIDWAKTWESIAGGAVAAWDAVATFFTVTVPAKFREWFHNLGPQMVQAGKDIVSGLWNGISSLGGWLFRMVGDFVHRNTIGRVQSLLGISSPSTVFAQIGQDTIAGYVRGVEQSARDAASATSMALAPAAAATAAAPAARAPVPVTAGDALMAALLDRVREEVRRTYGGNVDAALATVS